MALRKLRYEGDELLRKKSKPVVAFDKKLTDLLDDMAETLDSLNGLGLAAPQVGLLRRVVIINTEETGLIEIINPVILEQSGVQTVSEACLSIPRRSGTVERPATVKIKAFNRNGEEFELCGEELLARAICHELDHLDGILYTDKAISTENDEPEEDDEFEDGDIE